jgi:hypothetical protein
VTVNPGGGAGWDDSPLDIQVPDDARELDRDVIAYHRELRAKRRRSRLRRIAAPFGGNGTIMPLLASILAVCLVAGAMLSVATFSDPANGSRHGGPPTHPPTTAVSTTGTTATATASPTPSHSATVRPSGTAGSSPTAPAPNRTGRTATAQP